MNGSAGPGRPAQPPAGGRRAMSTGMGIALITAGAVLRFALSAGSPHGLNVHMVGVILILAGVLGLLLPKLARAPRDRLRRWVFPAKPQADDKPPTAEDPGVDNYRPTGSEDIFSYEHDPTLADDLLSHEHDPPLVENLPGYENRPPP
jgi:hypothetical protein